jgi:transketolase
MAAREKLEAEGIGTRVVSTPCWELFDAQGPVYQAAVIGEAPVRIAIEAAVRLGWERFIGDDGVFVGMKGFGASAPYEKLYEGFGITADAVVEAAKGKLK